MIRRFERSTQARIPASPPPIGCAQAHPARTGRGLLIRPQPYRGFQPARHRTTNERHAQPRGRRRIPPREGRDVMYQVERALSEQALEKTPSLEVIEEIARLEYCAQTFQASGNADIPPLDHCHLRELCANAAESIGPTDREQRHFVVSRQLSNPARRNLRFAYILKITGPGKQ